MNTHVTGGIELNGIMRVHVGVPSIQPYCQVLLKGLSRPIKGTIILSEILASNGFGISSTHPDDVGQTVYFDVIEVDGARERWEAQQAATAAAAAAEAEAKAQADAKAAAETPAPSE
jgi:hypothetical protein